jgi:hypothetical protein
MAGQPKHDLSIREPISLNFLNTFPTTLCVQILCFWTLSIGLSLSKNTALFILQNKVSETGYCLRLQVKPTQLGLVDRASPDLQTPVPASVSHLGAGTGVQR